MSDLRKALELEPGKKEKIQTAIERLQKSSGEAAAPRAAPEPSKDGERPPAGDGGPRPIERDSGLGRLEDVPATATIEDREVRSRAKPNPVFDDDLPEPPAARKTAPVPGPTGKPQSRPQAPSPAPLQSTGQEEAVMIE